MALLTNIVAYWKMDEASGNPVDATGNAFTLTNTNIVTYPTGKINNGATTSTSNTRDSKSGGIGADLHPVDAERLAGQPLGQAVDHDPALETDPHAAERAPRLARH